jgi:methionyl-tRNA formyltransferase
MSPTGMRIIFMGTPDFAVPALVALVEAGHDVVAAYSQPPRPGGRRGRELTPSPVQREAEARGIPVRFPVSLKGADEQAAFAALDADIAVVAAYGLILPQAVLDAPRLGCLNIHASILPRWRGAAPIQRAILAGDPTTGITIMQMEAGLDTGPMLATLRTPIERKTAGELTEELARRGGGLLIDTLRDLKNHRRGPRRSTRPKRGWISPRMRSKSSGRCGLSRRHRGRFSSLSASATRCWQLTWSMPLANQGPCWTTA